MTGGKNDGLVSGDRHMTRAELDERAARAAHGFRDIGVKPGDSIALFLRNDFVFFEASLAAQRIGAYAVPINWHFKAEEVEYILNDCGARAFIVHADLWPRVAHIVPAGVHVFIAPTPPELGAAYGLGPQDCVVPAEAQNWNVWVHAQQPAENLPPPATDSMIYTSGTTGNPKAVRRNPATPAQMEKAAWVRRTVYGFTPDMVAGLPGPLYHSAPNSFGLRAALTGKGVVLTPRFDPEGLLELIEKHRISHMFMVPTMFVRLLKLPKDVREKYDVSSLRYIIHAAAPCPPEAKRQMIEWWGPIIHEFYGSTESSAVTLATSEDALKKPGTVGRPIEGAEVVIVGENGEALGPNQTGEIFTRINGMPDFTYFNKPEKRVEIDRNGLITSGDVGYLDDDGYLFINDRKRDMVISGGVNIYPAEIESVALHMPDIKDCAVFGIPDAEFGESLMAVVEPQPGLDLKIEDVRAYLKQHLADYKVPRHIEIGHNLPREDSGKIFKRRLRDPYWEKAGRTI
ncbi:MAG: AMP-binding protein [Hyphomicrobiales bacterium]|nr:AMP-binding protein [Hyphomicrobiales bacterium]MCC2106993.1 AMP-binding protein [Hyphomicrobiales bacterium]